MRIRFSCVTRFCNIFFCDVFLCYIFLCNIFFRDVFFFFQGTLSSAQGGTDIFESGGIEFWGKALSSFVADRGVFLSKCTPGSQTGVSFLNALLPGEGVGFSFPWKGRITQFTHIMFTCYRDADRFIYILCAMSSNEMKIASVEPTDQITFTLPNEYPNNILDMYQK